jgi:tetratricopeptide (TPR) repeat protein
LRKEVKYLPLAEAKRLMQQGLYQQALHAAQLALWSGELNAADTAEVHYLVGRAQLATGQHFAAVHSLTQALAAAIAHRPDLLGQIEVDLGTAALWLGDLSEAQHLLQGALSRTGLSQGRQGSAVYNLAVIEEESGRYQDAINLYMVARDQYRQAGKSRKELDCILSMAWCYLLLAQAAPAHPLLLEAREWGSHLADVAVSDLTSPHWALYHRLLGDYATSMEYCQRAMQAQFADARDRHFTLGESAWIAGLNAFSMEHFAEARMFAQTALDHGIHLQWPSLLNRANKLRRQAERAMNRR